MDLVKILKRSEGKTLEFRRERSSPDGAKRVRVTPLATDVRAD